MRRRPLKKPMLNVVFARLSDFTILWQQLRLPWKQLKYPGPESWMEVVLVLAMTGVLGKASGFGSRPLVGWGLVVVEVGRGGGARGGIDAGSLGRRLLHDSWLWENWSQGKVGGRWWSGSWVICGRFCDRVTSGHDYRPLRRPGFVPGPILQAAQGIQACKADRPNDDKLASGGRSNCPIKGPRLARCFGTAALHTFRRPNPPLVIKP